MKGCFPRIRYKVKKGPQKSTHVIVALWTGRLRSYPLFVVEVWADNEGSGHIFWQRCESILFRLRPKSFAFKYWLMLPVQHVNQCFLWRNSTYISVKRCCPGSNAGNFASKAIGALNRRLPTLNTWYSCRSNHTLCLKGVRFRICDGDISLLVSSWRMSFLKICCWTAATIFQKVLSN